MVPSSIPQQCVPPSSLLSVLAIFALFSRYHSCMVNKFIQMIRRKNTHKMIILIIISNFFYSIFNFQVTYSFAHVKPSKRFISLFFALLCFFHNVFCNVRNQCLVNVLFLILDEPYLTRFGIF